MGGLCGFTNLSFYAHYNAKYIRSGITAVDYLFQVNNGIMRIMCELCSKLIINTPANIINPS